MTKASTPHLLDSLDLQALVFLCVSLSTPENPVARFFCSDYMVGPHEVIGSSLSMSPRGREAQMLVAPD